MSFLHDELELTSCEISLNTVPEGFKVPFNHKHKQNEEVYIVLKGEGKMIIDEQDIIVKEGSAIKVAPQAARTIENTSNNEFQFICIQAKANSLEQYGTVDKYGCFYFSGISPGNYKVKSDDSFIYSNSLENYENKSELSINIPYEYRKLSI